MKLIPRAPQRGSQSNRRRNQDIGLSRLDFLKRADVQIGQFGELFLGDLACHPFAPQVGSECLELASD